MRNEKITPLYERLSRDDELQGESNSISSQQKQMLEEFARRNGLPNPTHFTDDGVSGTRFDRPGFLAMIFDLKEEQSLNNRRTGSKPAGGGYGGTLHKPFPLRCPQRKESIMKQGTLVYDHATDRYDIRFDLDCYYGGLHCGECFDVMIGGKWKPTRIEMAADWYLVGIRTDDLQGLRVRM